MPVKYALVARRVVGHSILKKGASFSIISIEGAWRLIATDEEHIPDFSEFGSFTCVSADIPGVVPLSREYLWEPKDPNYTLALLLEASSKYELMPLS